MAIINAAVEDGREGVGGARWESRMIDESQLIRSSISNNTEYPFAAEGGRGVGWSKGVMEGWSKEVREGEGGKGCGVRVE